MRSLSPTFFLLLLALSAWTTRPVMGADEGGLSPDSPEYAAIMLAAPYVQSDHFELREDYWSGRVSGKTGTAVRLQFFKRNTYRLFFATEAAEAAKGTKLEIRVFDRDNHQVAMSGAQEGSAVMAELDPPATGLYLVLMRAEIKQGSAERQLPCVLFYGYE